VRERGMWRGCCVEQIDECGVYRYVMYLVTLAV
jgi:hypothetical protein